MAKGQQRSNREVRKPKKDKAAAPKADVPFSSMLKKAESTTPKGKPKA
ncbi:hypothetical protein [Phyllobacterium lublinensis]|jgi:hypothetical protein|nr:hypothetical protein [Phyllobacterium sp. 2063]MBZ9654150.1 hypothetical protein [Phyllobacterium sp. 2063]